MKAIEQQKSQDHSNARFAEKSGERRGKRLPKSGAGLARWRDIGRRVGCDDATVAQLDQPNGDPLTVPNALIFREAAGRVGRVFNGEGGDPCFGGPKNLPMVAAALFGESREVEGRCDRARERSYLRSFQKCFDDLPSLLGAIVESAIDRSAWVELVRIVDAHEPSKDLRSRLQTVARVRAIVENDIAHFPEDERKALMAWMFGTDRQCRST